ncbi:hypothetical protein ACRQ5Q_09805 [Bradyrhizobium sp. PMVTL-01]|uniref:hypothetical protein n=1 Tax=Bradyrhizobium sp. PMVTL-01 TaxID=3434999 RepID=UPI003F6ED0F7
MDDLELVRRIGERSKRMGATFASVVHPSHIPVINEIYSPSQDEIDEACGILSVMAEATSRGEAAVRHKSMLLDYAQAAGIEVGTVPKLELPPL